MDGEPEAVVKVMKLPGASLPKRASEGAAGFDIEAYLPQSGPHCGITLPPLGRAAIPTGLVFEIPEGYEGQVRPRSGLAKNHGITVLNSPGTIDSDYRGEVQIILINLSSESWTIKNGDRIAQIVFAPIAKLEIKETSALSETKRGEKGFGSSGL
jgi:dUTP pyrophosphatase